MQRERERTGLGRCQHKVTSFTLHRVLFETLWAVQLMTWRTYCRICACVYLHAFQWAYSSIYLWQCVSFPLYIRVNLIFATCPDGGGRCKSAVRVCFCTCVFLHVRVCERKRGKGSRSHVPSCSWEERKDITGSLWGNIVSRPLCFAGLLCYRSIYSSSPEAVLSLPKAHLIIRVIYYRVRTRKHCWDIRHDCAVVFMQY